MNELEVDSQTHLGKKFQRFLFRQQPRVSQRAVSTPYFIFQLFLAVKSQRLAGTALMRHDFRDGALEIFDNLLFRKAQRQLIGYLEQAADRFLGVAIDCTYRQSELRRNIYQAADIARKYQSRQMQKNGGTKPRAEICRT